MLHNFYLFKNQCSNKEIRYRERFLVVRCGSRPTGHGLSNFGAVAYFSTLVTMVMLTTRKNLQSQTLGVSSHIFLLIYSFYALLLI